MGPHPHAGIAQQNARPHRPGRRARGLQVQRRPNHVAQVRVVIAEQLVENGSRRRFRHGKGGLRRRGPDGHRAAGHRVMRLPLGQDGLPSGAPQPLLAGWDALAKVRPEGRPTGATIDIQGRLWVIEDFNRTVLLVRKP